MRYRLLLIFIIVLASILRLTFLDTFPKGLHYQEATVGWRAQNLISSGRDEFGRQWPIFFSNWTEIEMPLPTYLSLPFVAISNRSIFFLRLPFAITGVMLIIGSILLVQKLFPDKKNLGLWVGFVLTVSPVTIWFSRIVNPQIMALVLIIWGWYFLSLKRWKGLGAILLGSSVFALAQAFIFVLGWMVILIWKREKLQNLFWNQNTSHVLRKMNGSQKNFPEGILRGLLRSSSLLACLPLIIFIILFISNKSFYANFWDNNLSVFNDNSIVSNINLIRGHNLKQGVLNIINGLFLNKLFFVILILKNFLAYFNPSYIFARGDGNFLNGLSNFGLMLLTTFPLFVYGLYTFIKKKYQHLSLILGWFVLTILDSLFISNAPDSKRFLLAAFPLSVFIGVGLMETKKVWRWLFLVLIFFNLMVVSYDGLVKESIRQQAVFHQDTLDLVSFIDQEAEGNVWLTDQIDPNLGPKIGFLRKLSFQDSNLKENQANIYKSWVSQIGNIYIGNKDQLKMNSKKFNFILKSEKEESFGCFLPKSSFGEGDSKYILLIKCQEPILN